jgi:hypothetical protein
MAFQNRISLLPRLQWLTLNLGLIFQCVLRNNIYIFFNFTYPVKCFLILPPKISSRTSS